MYTIILVLGYFVKCEYQRRRCKYYFGVIFTEILKIIITSVVSLIVLFLLTKLVGNKQLSELNMFDYIVSITIGSIAAELATELENPEQPLTAMIAYGVISFGVSVLCSKSIAVRRIIFGHSVILMKNGKLYKESFKKCRLDLNEFLMQCRLNGFYDLSALDTAVMEASGKISFLPRAAKRPATPEDLKLVPSGEGIFFTVIADGEILHRNLNAAGRDEKWLAAELRTQGFKNTEKIFLAVLDGSGTLNAFEDCGDSQKTDCFE